MGAFDKFEKHMENVVDNVFSRAFRSDLQPVELATGIKKSMDDQATALTRERTIVPNHFLIAISEHDFGKLAEWGESELVEELVRTAEDYARAIVGNAVARTVASTNSMNSAEAMINATKR